MRQEFNLVPWRSSQDLAPLPGVEIAGWIDRAESGDLLEIQYWLVGDLAALAIAPAAEIPSRRFGLWEATCLEFFLAPLGQAYYWEFNLSPSGDWNVFRLEGYREGLRDEVVFQTLPFQVSRQERQLSLSLSMGLEGLVDRSIALELAVTAVIQDRDGGCSYWALSHPGLEADFHRRDGFTMQLPAGIEY
jgi:hypothetical protein